MNEGLQAEAIDHENGVDQMIDEIALQCRLPRVYGRDRHIEICFLDMQLF